MLVDAGTARSSRRRTLVAVALAVTSVGCTAAAIDLYRWNAGRTELVALSFADVVVAAAFPPMVAWIVSRQPNNRMGWVMLSTALVGPWLLASQYAVAALVILDDPNPVATFASWLSMWGYAPYWVLIGLVPLLFPDGTLPSPRWRGFVAVVSVAIVVGIGARMLTPTQPDASPGVSNPWGIAGADWLAVVTVVCAIVCIPVAGAVGVVSLFVRARRARSVEQARLHVLLLGVLGLVTLTAIGPLVGPGGADVSTSLGLLFFIGAIGVAAVRHGLFDVTVVLNRALVYGLLTVVVLVAYLAVVAAVGRITAGTEPAYLAVAAAAVVAAAGRSRAQQLVDRLLFGDRRDPYAMLRRLDAGFDLATGPVDALEQLAGRVRGALRLPYVAVHSVDPRLGTVASGSPSAAVERYSISAQGREVGTLLVGHRQPRERFGPQEQALFAEVARRAGSFLHAAALVYELQHSRERIVVTREEERRRLRRELHDGVGPALAGMAMQLEGLVDRLAEPALVQRVVGVRDQMRRTIADLRGVVDGLRPPAVDELGLPEALAEHVNAWAPLVRLQVRDPLPEVSAAAEVAAYRIATEAVTNVVRHARASTCQVTLAGQPGWLVVEVRDDGVGLPAEVLPGVGMWSMRERAAEVGGRFDVDSQPGCGTTVRARLPVAAS